MTDVTGREGTRTGSTAESPGGAKGPDELRRQIERTRGELGDTVEELAAKADVKGRARARAADLRGRAGTLTARARGTAAQAGHPVRVGRAHPRVLLVAGAVTGALITAGVLRHRHRGYC